MANEILQYQMTKPAPIVYAHVVTPRPASAKLQNKEPRYEATFLLTPDHPDFKPIEAAMIAAAKGKFGSTDGRKFPLQRGDKLADEAAAKDRDREWARGKVLLATHANTTKRDGSALNPPRLVVVLNGKYVRFTDEPERSLARQYFYSGVQAVGTFSFVPYEGMGGGVSCYLNEILSLNVGEKINTGVDDETKYGAPTQYIGKLSSTDPTSAGEEISY